MPNAWKAMAPTRGWCANRSLVLGWALAAGGAGASPPSHMLVVAGLGGEAAYADAFAAAAAVAADRAGAAGASVTLLAGESATRAGIAAAIAAIAAEAGAEDATVAHFIGHGTFDGEHYRFNVPGPDPTGTELAAWLDALPARRLVILTTSAGGAAVDALRPAAGAVISATRDGREANAVVFHRYWSEALGTDAADTDKDQRITAAEAFRYAERAVADHYADAQRIATEHPRVEGDAGGFTVARLTPAPAPRSTNPQVAALAERSDGLTAQVHALKAKRALLPAEEYAAQLQALLLELAGVERDRQRLVEETPADAADDSPARQ